MGEVCQGVGHRAQRMDEAGHWSHSWVWGSLEAGSRGRTAVGCLGVGNRSHTGSSQALGWRVYESKGSWWITVTSARAEEMDGPGDGAGSFWVDLQSHS